MFRITEPLENLLEKNTHGNKRVKGNVYEDKAAAYLEEKGYRILEKNFQARGGEIDLIAQIRNVLVFVEVKFRESKDPNSALEAVTPAKQKNIIAASLYYLMRNPLPIGMDMRFDVIGIDSEGEVTHIEQAFDGGSWKFKS